MNLRKWMQIILVGGSIMTLTACSSAHKYRDTAAINDANSSYSDAQSSGAGDESSFGDDQTGSKKHHMASNKNVYYFDFDSNVVHDNDKPAINEHAQYLSSNTKSKAMLEGHTDPRGSREYNIGLGERRAKSVAEVMASNGADPSQIRIVSYGAEKLAANGYSEADYQKDRRVVLNVQR